MTDRSNFTGRFNRTLPATNSQSNFTLRFPHTRREAGILGPLAPVEGDGFGRWAGKIAAAALAGGVVYVLLVCVMSVG